MEPLIPIREAETLIHASCQTLGTEWIPLSASVGRVLASGLSADRDLPPYPRSMMDGVAFDSSKIPVPTRLRIAGLHAAGDSPPRPLEAGEAWEIMTGAVVPEDCDTVVPYEDLADNFSLTSPFKAGQCIHPRGLDARAGDMLVKPGRRIGPAEVAIAASIGLSEVEVFRRPRVAIITTGDEAVPVDATPEAWQIRQSNGPMLEAALVRLGYMPVERLHVNDDPREAGEAIAKAIGNVDMILMCGGISMGKKDHVRALLENHLGTPAFHGVRLRPGKPLAFWGGPPCVFALPGNPVSVLATFTLFVIPALRRIEGHQSSPLRVQLSGVSPLPQFSWLLPVAAEADGRLVPAAPRNSGDFVSIAGSIGIVEIPPGSDLIPNLDFAFHPFP